MVAKTPAKIKASTPAGEATPAAIRRTPKPSVTPQRVLESRQQYNDQRIAEMTVKALQDALRTLGAAVSGRKADLQERLLDTLESRPGSLAEGNTYPMSMSTPGASHSLSAAVHNATPMPLSGMPPVHTATPVAMSNHVATPRRVPSSRSSVSSRSSTGSRASKVILPPHCWCC